MDIVVPCVFIKTLEKEKMVYGTSISPTSRKHRVKDNLKNRPTLSLYSGFQFYFFLIIPIPKLH
ncbi:hypothetical protein L0N00_16105, partial [Eggerthella lenta]|nr:hypothetical protein [Eggerthella lenta]